MSVFLVVFNWCNSIFNILSTRLYTAHNPWGFRFVSFHWLKTNSRTYNVSVPEQDSPVSSCLIGKAYMIFMKQANKQCVQVAFCAQVSVAATSSSAEVVQAAGLQDLVFRMKAVRKWQSRRFSFWDEGGKWVRRAVQPFQRKIQQQG